MGSRLTKAQARALRALEERPLDLVDWRDKLRLVRVQTIYETAKELRGLGLIDWMYDDDQASLSPAGRRALHEHDHAG